jgi:serine protease Do
LDAVEVGQDVIAIGSPLGLEGTVTRGIVSGLRSLGKIPLVQIDAAINPGNSGGPLLDASGQVIGVNTLKLRPSTAESLGFAIGVDHVKALFGSLLDR